MQDVYKRQAFSIIGSIPAKGFLPDCVKIDIGEFKHSHSYLLILQNQRGYVTLFDNGSEN